MRCPNLPGPTEDQRGPQPTELNRSAPASVSVSAPNVLGQTKFDGSPGGPGVPFAKLEVGPLPVFVFVLGRENLFVDKVLSFSTSENFCSSASRLRRAELHESRFRVRPGRAEVLVIRLQIRQIRVVCCTHVTSRP